MELTDAVELLADGFQVNLSEAQSLKGAVMKQREDRAASASASASRYMVQASPEATAESRYMIQPDSRSSPEPPPPPPPIEPPSPPLKASWSKFYDSTYNAYYYHNASTGESTWDRPEGVPDTEDRKTGNQSL